MNKQVINILALLIFPLGFAVGQNVVGQTDSHGSGGKINAQPTTKAKGANESKPTPLPATVNPVDKSKSSGTKPTIAPLPKTAIKNKQ
jgi:hypothetical protein